MKQKTIRLGSEYQMSIDDTVICWVPDPSGGNDYVRRESCYRVGARVVLVSITDVSPNSRRDGKINQRFELRFSPDGIAGNSNPNILRFHGWRGTTNDISLDAHGEREIIRIKELKNGEIAVTVGPDLNPDSP